MPWANEVFTWGCLFFVGAAYYSTIYLCVTSQSSAQLVCTVCKRTFYHLQRTVIGAAPARLRRAANRSEGSMQHLVQTHRRTRAQSRRQGTHYRVRREYRSSRNASMHRVLTSLSLRARTRCMSSIAIVLSEEMSEQNEIRAAALCGGALLVTECRYTRSLARGPALRTLSQA